jgi:predicted oxidoreductase
MRPSGAWRVATEESDAFSKARNVCDMLAKKYGVSLSTIIYAWILNHPVGALPLVGSNKLERLEDAISALDLRLDREDWYRVYVASGQQKIR